MTYEKTDELGTFLRACRERLQIDPDSGRASSTRRTPGMRRAEVAVTANISVEWYSRLEQGRGGRPSIHVLEAICEALRLKPKEREHAFLLAYGTIGASHQELSPAERRKLRVVLDALEPCPAYLKSPSWDILEWNAAAARVLTDYAALPAAERNVLRILFTHSASRRRIRDWPTEAKLAVATFRSELVRWEERSPRVQTLIHDLRTTSPDFDEIWRRNEVGHLGEGTKTILMPDGSETTMQYTSFNIDAHPGTGLVVYTPVTDATPLSPN
ncbi:helix-turn-helix transcriptional regulator [Streptomyces sp. NPDC102365]|uniref:helix-turn-helix transcriptional regulator n=1 Tax=Streptomyces sp. NPDC102365 TaxID=3366162 RepID=UPI00381BBD2C